MLSPGRGVGVFLNQSQEFESAIWAGTWSSVNVQDQQGMLPPLESLAAPAPLGGGAVTGDIATRFNVFTPATLAADASTWDVRPPPPFPDGSTAGNALIGNLVPVVASTASGVVALSTRNFGSFGYYWATVGTTVSGPTPINGVPLGEGRPGGLAAVGAVHGPVVAVFNGVSQMGQEEGDLIGETFDGVTWTSPSLVATEGMKQPTPYTLSMAALPDGRVALVYSTSSGGLMFGFWSNGSGWGTFNSVSSPAAQNFAIAAGVGDAELELVLATSDGQLEHCRLMPNDAGDLHWTSPVLIPAPGFYESVFVAEGPSAPPPPK